jgi:RNA polymerase sigma factor (sigma-70 family)
MSISEDLLKKCIANDQAALKQLYKLLAAKLFATCLRYTKSRQEAEDWLQEGFIKIFQNLGNFKNEGVFEGWTRRIVVNHILSELRKKKRLGSVSDLESVINISESLENIQSDLQYEEMIRFINLLPEGKKLIFNLYVIEGYSHKEISEMLNINEGTSRGQLAKAKELLIEIHRKHNSINAERIS